MLGTVAKELGLPAPMVRVEKPSWAFAESLHLGDGVHLLVVYRSTWLRDTDPQYENVRALLDRNEHEEIYRHSREDEGMFFRHGEWICYVLNPVPDLSPVAKMVIDLVKQWGDSLHPMDVPSSIAMRLQFLEGVGGTQ